MRRHRAAVLFCTLSLVFASGSTLLAQTSEVQPATTATTTTEKPNLRFFQMFATDAAIVERQWYGVEFRWQNGAVPPIENADGILLTPTIAISLFKNLEVGGTVSYVDYELDSDIVRPDTSSAFSGDSGLGDLTAWAKYRFMEGPVSLTAGALFTIPTGSEDEGLGTGEFVPAMFAAINAQAGDGHFLGTFGLRFNHDAEVLNAPASAKTSSVLGGGYIWEAFEGWAFSGEVAVESERFDGGSSDFRATAGVQFLGLKHSRLRGAASLGLTEGAPDFELILGYAYQF